MQETRARGWSLEHADCSLILTPLPDPRARVHERSHHVTHDDDAVRNPMEQTHGIGMGKIRVWVGEQCCMGRSAAEAGTLMGGGAKSEDTSYRTNDWYYRTSSTRAQGNPTMNRDGKPVIERKLNRSSPTCSAVHNK